MDVCKLILQVVDSLPLLSYVLLVVISLISDRHKEVFNVFEGDRTRLHVLDCFS